MQWFESLFLGVVQGLTEFLPVSSDGHLSITQQAFAWFIKTKRTGAENLFFDVMLHLGTFAAIVVHYRSVVKTGIKGLLGSSVVPPPYRRAAVVRVGLLAAVATTPLIPLALFFKKWIDKTFESTAAAGVGFLITAAVLLLTTQLQTKSETGKGPAETTWLDALLIGLAQMFAPLPGVSRSGLTVASALGLGLSRAWAVGFSLLIAVPAILGAAVFEVRKVDSATLDGDRIAQTIAAACVAGIVGYGAIIWLVKIVRSGRLWYFSVYLLILGAMVLAGSQFFSGGSSVRNADADYGASRLGSARGLAGRTASAGRHLAGSDAAGTNAGAGAPGAKHGREPRTASLVLGRPLA
jgi:undecaprenyl-diphosphatase